VTSPDDPYAPPPGYGGAPNPYAPPPGFGGQPEPYVPPPGYGPPPQQWQQYGYGPGGQRTNTKAALALGLAISAYLPIVPFVGAIVALFLVGPAKREIYASGGRETGLGLCTAAKVVAIVHLAFIALVVLALVALVAVPFSFS
jgi:hypothetical protein